MKMLVAATESGNEGLDDEGAGTAAISAAPQGTNDSLNHRAYKTVLLFKSCAILSIYEVCHASFNRLI